jgi:iron complex transport system substrate-binding protein
MSRIPGKSGLCSVLVMAMLFVIGCDQSGQRTATTGGDSSKDKQGPSPIRYAHGFRIDRRLGYREVSILNRAAGRSDTLRYLLVDSGQAAPADRPGIPVIHTPVRTMVVLASAHIGLAEFAGAADRIAGLGNLQYVSSPVVRAGIRAGRVRQVGVDGSTNNELVIAMHPGVMITSTNPDAAFGQYQTISEAGIPVVPDAEWLETTPLGRAEWVKLIGALIDNEEEVGKKFDSVERAYRQLAEIGSSAKTRPSVIIDMPWKGTWYTPAGENYMAQLLRDAGASYNWSETKGIGSLALNVEAVIPVALKAEYWLNVGNVNSRKDIEAMDPRFAQFRAFQTDSIYNFNKRVNDIGSNDFWESGLANPQLILADVIRILHPGMLPPDSLYYYKQLK